MAIEFGKGIALAGGFDLGAKAPLDSRLTVSTIEERDAHVTGNRAYEGMLVYVEADKITYQYVADAEGNLSWKEFGFNETDFLNHIANNLTTEESGMALSAAQGVVLKGMIEDEATARTNADDALKLDIDKLDAYIGEIPNDYTETNIVAYINKKAEETLNNAAGGSSESAASVLAALNTYKAENDPKVAANTTAATNAQTTADNAQNYAEGVASDLADEVKAREEADTALDERIVELEGTIVGLSGAMHFKGVKDEIPADVSAYEQGDVIIVGNKEYVFNNGSFVEFGDASVNAEAITNLTGRVSDAESDIADLQAADVTMNTAIAEKVAQTVYDSKVKALEDADTAMAGRLDDIEAVLGENEDTIDGRIADAVAAEATLREEADSLKADKTAVEAISDKVTTLEGEMTQAKTDIDAVEKAVATKAEQTDLEAEVTAREFLAERVVAVEDKAHTHVNADVVNAITAEDVANWNSAEENANKFTTDEINRVEAIIGDVDADKTVVQLIADLRTECEANETAAIAAAQEYTNTKILAVNDAIEAAIGKEETRVDAEIAKKVDKIEGKGLSTNDLTNELKGQYDAAYEHSQIAHAPVNAQANIIESVKVNGTALTITDKVVDIAVPTDNAQMTNGAGYLVANDIVNKADKATTLAGYGISDAYTSAETDAAIANAMNSFVEVSAEEINQLFA